MHVVHTTFLVNCFYITIGQIVFSIVPHHRPRCRCSYEFWRTTSALKMLFLSHTFRNVSIVILFRLVVANKIVDLLALISHSIVLFISLCYTHIVLISISYKKFKIAIFTIAEVKSNGWSFFKSFILNSFSWKVKWDIFGIEIEAT